MSIQVTLTIPDELYSRAESLAKATKQDVAEVLADAIVLDVESEPAAEDVEAQQAMASEEAAYRAMHSTLYASYPGQYIAIYQGELVDRDPDFATLCNRIDDKYPDQIVLITKVQATPDQVFRIRSPRVEYST